MCFLSKDRIYIFSATFFCMTFVFGTEFACKRKSGTCRLISDCPDVFNFPIRYNISKLQNPCAYTRDDKLICCPNKIIPNSCTIDLNQKFEQECKRYADMKGDRICLNPYVHNGKNAIPKEFPFMARIGRFHPNNITFVDWNCGGTLISNKFVLTAAHCFISETESKDIKYRVRLGDLDFQSTEDDANVQEFDVTSNCTYHDFKEEYDIAVIELNNTVEFDDYIFPACLPSPSCAPFPDLQVAGWGITERDGKQAAHLQKAVITNIIPDNDVSASEDATENMSENATEDMSEDTTDDPSKLNPTQIFYGSTISQENTCDGDSGGPLFWNHPNYECIKLVFGIVASDTNSECLGGVTPYTKVSYFIKFIENLVWLNKTCSDVRKLQKANLL